MTKIIDNDNLVFPNYKKSILNLSALFAKIYGVNTGSEPLAFENLQNLSDKRNIVFIIFDGFGYNLISRYYSDKLPFFKKHLKDKLTSVFPSTTAAAITSIYTAKVPAEHGVMGWALYFKEFFRIFDYLPTKDTSTGKAVSESIYDYYKLLKPDSVFRKIIKKNPELNISYITPKYLKGTPYNKLISQGAKTIAYSKESSMLKKILKITANKKRNFIVAYSTNPDSIEHHKGVNSKEVEKFLIKTDKDLKLFYDKLPEDTAVFISADHGLTEIDDFYIINDDTTLNNCLILPPFPESRFVSFFVKPHKTVIFEEAFRKYQNDFMLFTRDEFLTYGFLGDAKPHYKLDDFIGNYLAIAIGNKGFRYLYRQKKDENKIFRAHHSGLTKDEMEIPLFYFEK